MTRDEPKRTEVSSDAADRGSTRFGRRSMLLALGAGSSVGLASQYGRVNGQEDGEDGAGEGTETGTDDGDGAATGQQCPPCIDRYSGYLQAAETKEGGQELSEFEPVLTVEMRVTDADVVFPEPEEGGQGNGTAGDASGTPTGEFGTGTPMEGTETGTPPGETGTGTGTPMTGEETGTPMMGNGTGTGEPPVGGEGGVEGFPDFYFDPVGISLRPGDVVEFITREEFHTVTAFHPRYFGYQQRVPEGVPGFSSPPVLENDSWYYRFDEPGVYDMLCLPHESLGMVMRAVVQEDGSDEVPEEYEELPTGGESGVAPIDQRVLNAPELDPANVLERGTVAWTDLTEVASEPPFGP